MASYVPLEGTSLKELGIAEPGFDGSPVSFFATSSFVYSMLFLAIIVAAFYRYTLAGIWRMESSPASIKKSDDEFKRVSLGLLGVFSMFLIIFTVNKGLLTGDIQLQELSSVKGVGGGTVVQGGGVTKPTTGTTPTPGGNVPTGSDEATTRKPLLDAGITFNHDACVGSNTSRCTNIAGINQKSIDMLLALKLKCGCSIQITGGTEGGHSVNSNHGIGKEAVDISLNQDLLTFLKNNGTNVGDDTKCNTKYSWRGSGDQYIFWDEAVGCDKSRNENAARHFHVSFTGR
jgi:hypothetical protein